MRKRIKVNLSILI